MQEQKGGNSSPNEAADVPVAGNQECMAVLCSTWLLRRGEERETFRRMEKGRTEGRGVEIRAEKGKGLEKYGKGKIRRERGGRDRKGRKRKTQVERAASSTHLDAAEGHILGQQRALRMRQRVLGAPRVPPPAGQHNCCAVQPEQAVAGRAPPLAAQAQPQRRALRVFTKTS